MANFNLIRDLCEKNKITQVSLAEAVGLKDGGTIQRIIKQGSTNTKTLERISAVLGVHPGIFFDGPMSGPHFTTKGNHNHVENVAGDFNVGLSDVVDELRKRIDVLSRLCEEKDRVIDLQKKLIDKNEQK